MSAQPVHYEFPEPEPSTGLRAVPTMTGGPREIAEQIENATGLRVEIIRGTFMMSPAPGRRHAETVDELRELLRPCRADGLRTYEVVAIPLPDDPDDYVIPDLVVCPAASMSVDEKLMSAEEVELAIEVVSPSERPGAIADKVAWYAESGVPFLLYLFPSKGAWILYSLPSDDGYRTITRGKYGDPVPLPDHLNGEMSTDTLPRYGV
ncbi:Uma2 family endonuclease [Streptomyces sp. URMC 126]|uniref:Uma2 family endonuclease n=1 Tax=Streptomyces sp. URMC 126 TaxID=3423401 RepID=UPI003F194A8B